LESGEVRRIGENTSMTCDVRVVCATLRDLGQMVHDKDFREDLWFRINTFEINLPPLRERLEDLPELILHLAQRFPKGKGVKDGRKLFTEIAFRMLEQYDWPGNIRQLANTIEHALILCDKLPIGIDALPQTLRPRNEKPSINPDRLKKQKPSRPAVNKTPDIPCTIPMSGPVADLMSFDPTIDEELTTLRDMEMKAISTALIRHDGNKAKAAEELGISLKTLYNKLNQFDAKRTA
jgi:two-component system NtrC family response regulator